jgi:hypothetical protein
VGDLSVTTVLLLLRDLVRPVLGWAAIDARSRLALQILVAAGGLALYPLALGLRPFDPYRLGYGNECLEQHFLILAVRRRLFSAHLPR